MSKLLEKAYFSNNMGKKRSHYHDCHQIILITKGEVEFGIYDQTQIAKEGSLLIFSRFEKHMVNVLSKEYERYVLHINANTNFFDSYIFSLLFNRPKGFDNLIDVSKKFELFKNLLSRLIDEYNGGYNLSDDMQKLLLEEILIMIYREQPNSFNFDPTIYLIQQKLESDCSKNYTLTALAKEHNISVSSLSHRFNDVTGTSVMGYLFSCRIALAKKLLTTTNIRIGEIVENCGFSDNSNFSRLFKQQNGITPSAFRAKYKR